MCNCLLRVFTFKFVGETRTSSFTPHEWQFMSGTARTFPDKHEAFTNLLGVARIHLNAQNTYAGKAD